MSETANPTSHTYFSQRLRLHYLDWGNAQAPHMLMVHGMRDHCHTWDWMAQKLRQDYHIVAPDLRGHGDSAWVMGSSYSHMDYVYDLAQLIRQARLEPVTLVAHSLGGTLACQLAGLYPDAVARMVVIEGVGLGWSRRFERMAPHERIMNWIDNTWKLAGREPRRYESLDEAYQRMQKSNKHLTPEQARHLTIHGSNQNEDGTYSWKFDNYTHANAPYDIPADDVQALWERITCPVLFINSKQGFPGRTGQGDSLQHFRNARVMDIDQAGHWTHHDQLDAVLAATTDFLRE